MEKVRNVISAAQAIQLGINRETGPPEGGRRSSKIEIIPFSLVRNTRRYIESVTVQINGAYENGWYDACSVMIRRLLETLIIEAFEAHSIDEKIKNSSGDFLFLSDLIDKTLKEADWNLGRNAKKAMPRLKDIGDKSAHSRRFTAQRGDIEPLRSDIRTVVEELIHLARLK